MNPMEMMQQLSSFMSGYKGNPREDAMKMIQNSNMSQQQLNNLQNQASQLYMMGKQMGFIK